MVRLKDIYNEVEDISIMISIPYGAIKRKIRANVELMLLLISIPYGAIKSKNQEYGNTLSN